MSGKEMRRCVFAAVAFAAMMAVSPGGASAGVIFSDDFESGTLLTSASPAGKWDSISTARGTVSIATLPNPVFEGSYTGHLHWASGSGGLRLYSPTWGGMNEIYIRTFVYIAEFTGISDDLYMFQAYSGAGGIFTPTVRRSGLNIRVEASPASDPGGSWPTWCTGSTALELDRWYCIEVYFRHCSGVGNNDGEITIWLDGVQEASATGLDTSDGAQVNPITYWGLGAWASDMTADIYFDNVWVADTMLSSAMQVLSPTSGLKWGVDSTHDIVWITGDTVAIPNVQIQLSRDGGTVWEDIAASTANTGTYSWPVDGGFIPLPQDQCIIRVLDEADGDPSDESGTFSITGAGFTITSPAGGEQWVVDSSVTIDWTTEGIIDFVDVRLSRDDGATWEDLATNMANTGSFVWTVDDGGQATPQTSVIRVWDYTNHSIYDDSETFTLTVGWITITQPAGGEWWAGGSAQQLLWTSNLQPDVNVEIALSYDSGATYRVLTAATINDGVSFFGVPDRPTDEARFRISFGQVVGESADFSITPLTCSWLFQDGFESGTLLTTDTPAGAWDSTSLADNSSLTVVTTPSPYAGTYCLDLHVDNTVGSDGNDSTYARLSKTVNSAGMAWATCRAFVMQQARPAEHFELNLLGFGGDSWLFTLYTWSDTGSFKTERPPGSNPAGTYIRDIAYADSGVLDDDSAWHQLDVYFKSSTVDNAPDGAIVLHYDGAFRASADSFDTTGGMGTLFGVKSIALNGWNGSSTNMDATLFWDAVGVSDSHPSGPLLVVLAPDGGEEWLVDDDEGISWHVTDKLDRDITHVDIEISRDGGTTWTTIESNVDVATLAYDAAMDSYTYTWTVTHGGLPTTPPQDLCLIRVTEFGGTASDDSDFNFTIGAAQVQVLTPNGGEEWGLDTSQTITWTSFGVTAVDIDVSYDGGGSWNDIIITAAAAGSYTWDVTGALSTMCVIRITDTVHPTAFDESDAVFSTVNAAVQVTAPNGAETFNVGDATDITWTSTGLANVHIELSRDGGTTWEDIEASTDASTGTYPWTVTGPMSATGLVRISDPRDDTPGDDSDAVFTIQGVEVTVPNGAESWDAGTTQTITWNAQGPAQVDIELSRDNGTTWESITTNVNAALGTYDWDVTAPGSDNCLIKISDSATGSPADESDDVFTIAGVTVTAPNGTEVWNLDDNVNITWSSAGFTNAHIELSRDGGTTWEDIAASADATVGSYPWTVAGSSSTNCLVRVSDVDGSPTDVSNAVFEISIPGITVTSPLAGDVWPVGSSQDITWSVTGIADVKIDVTRDGGTTWEEIVASIPAVLSSYTWPSVTGPGCATCVIRLRDVDNPWTVYADSGVFTISEITVTTPAAGDVWGYDGDDQDITWTSIGITVNVDIAYSTDGGTSWTDVALNEPDDGTYTWTIPNEDSTNCMVRVEETGGGEAVGLSEVFTLTPASITVTLPVAGSSWGLSTAQEITWTAPGMLNVMIELSRDGNWVNGDGSDVDVIVASTDATTGTYTWGSVTTPESTNCLVRVSDVNDGTPSGVSGTFVIATSSLALTSPNGGEAWGINRSARISWNQVGVATVHIELSTDGGTGWTDIVTDADGQQGYYDWTVTAGVSETCLVRISSGALNDMSVGTFWIINPNGDTDGDGFTDQEEVDGGTNPFDKKDKPPVMFHGKTGCGAGVGGGWLALVAALAGMSVLKRRK